MTVIFLTDYKTKCHGVPLRNIGFVKVQKFEDNSKNENNILFINPLETFLGKCKVCDMSTDGESVYNGNTVLLKISEECDRHMYIYIGGNMMCTFLTNGNIYDYIFQIWEII